MSLSNNRVSDYQFPVPLAEETRAKLYKTLGAAAAETMWSDACRTARCSHYMQPTVDELIEIGMALSKNPGLAGVYGCTLSVRARSFRALLLKSAAKLQGVK